MQDEEATCGRGLAENAVVPAALARAAAGMAQNLELHTRALGSNDAAAIAERGAYERIAHSLRSAAAELHAAAAAMTSAADLPMGAHDVALVDAADAVDAFSGLVAAEDDLRRLLDARRVDNEQMLAAIRAEAVHPGT